MTKHFRQRHGKHLRKETRPAESLREQLESWFVRFWCSASVGSRDALGRLDPVTKEPLFSSETKSAVLNCKEKAECLQDPSPLEDMCCVIVPNPNSPHGLKECLSRRGESNLESFHLNLAHFGNSGMRESLADNLNVASTARRDLAIRRKLHPSRMSLDVTAPENHAKIPAAWESVVDCFDHSELECANAFARRAGTDIQHLPFQFVQPLVKDTGEQFFSECLAWLTTEKACR